jgi:hypothetical protein
MFHGRMRADTKSPDIWGRGLRTTERAGAHSLQFGTYALWTAGVLAALAVRPVSVMHANPSTLGELSSTQRRDATMPGPAVKGATAQ